MINKYQKRFKEIIKIFTKYGCDFLIDLKFRKKSPDPVNLRCAFEELGPTFIKIGQILSTRPDILPIQYVEEFRKLQDDVYPISFDSIDSIFNSEFNKSISDCFLNFNKSPLASASIAQVHKATLLDGRKVIVKIQRPNISEKMEVDIHIIKKLLRLYKNKLNAFPINPYEALDEIWQASKEELDFEIETNNIKHFSKNNDDVAFIYTPYVVEELCSSKVLTLEKIKGIKIDNLISLKENSYDLDDIAKKLALGFLKQIFKDGFFHGDPHPGNILIKDNKICFIDFGIMGNLSNNLRAALNDAIVALALQDTNKLINIFLSIGIRKGFVDKNSLYIDMKDMLDMYTNTSLSNIKMSLMLEDIFSLIKKHNIQLPKDLTLVMKSLVLLESTISILSPDINIMDIAIPYVKNNSKLFENLTVNELSLKGFTFFKNALKMPSKFIELSDNLINGRATVKIEHRNLSKPTAALNKMINRVVFGVVVSAMILSSSLIITSNVGPKVYGLSIIGVIGFIVSAIFGLWLLISILKSGLM